MPEARTELEMGFLFEVVKLKVGEALLFAPSAVMDLDMTDGGEIGLQKLGIGFLKVRARARLTTDGGEALWGLNAQRDECVNPLV